MIMLYFSGTGNSKYIANLFCEKMNAKAYSIEENIDFQKLIKENDTIGFCYPIYASSVPRIMREFVKENVNYLKGKKLIIFCTQLIISGDGARAFTDLLPKDYVDVIYAEHFDMPNNICNIKKFLVKNGDKTRRTVKKAEKKLDRVCRDIRAGKVKKRGFNNISIMIGKGQNKSWAELEEKNKSSVEIDDDCIKCGLCVKLCPMDNLNLTDKGIVQNDNCIFCYRCVNACPKRAITTLIHKKPEVQYKGIKTNKTTESC